MNARQLDSYVRGVLVRELVRDSVAHERGQFGHDVDRAARRDATVRYRGWIRDDMRTVL